jgi:hypothetical protein
MSTLRVTEISNENDNGAPDFVEGFTVAANTQSNVTGNLSVTGETIFSVGTNFDGLNSSGIVTATNFIGNGTFLTAVPGVSRSVALGYSIILQG